METVDLVALSRKLSVANTEAVSVFQEFAYRQETPFVKDVPLKYLRQNFTELHTIVDYINDFENLVNAIVYQDFFSNHCSAKLLKWAGVTKLAQHGFVGNTIDRDIPINEVLTIDDLVTLLEATIKQELLKHKIRGDVFIDLDLTGTNGYAYSIDLFILRTVNGKRYNIRMHEFYVTQ